MSELKLYRLVEDVHMPGTIGPGRYVCANDDGVVMALDVDRETDTGAIADRVQAEARAYLARSPWFRPGGDDA
jgi:hypothetical protein